MPHSEAFQSLIGTGVQLQKSSFKMFHHCFIFYPLCYFSSPLLPSWYKNPFVLVFLYGFVSISRTFFFAV
uniref:Uncharacterized protein n=1 Tax=Octopus bimaculoides TaxID=37653 RepID=A0A0L8I3F6_OCTBM